MTSRVHAFPHRQAEPAPRVRLFCFPYAGGSATAFHRWRSAFGGGLEVCAYEPPGRGTRFGEPLCRSMSGLVSDALEAVSAFADVPAVLFGHSLGALVAWELAAALESRGAGPRRLIVAGCRAPHRPSRLEPVAHLPDPELVARLRELGGTPEEVLAEPELLELVLPILRADFRIAETHIPDEAIIGAPITALGGHADDLARPPDVRAWKDRTRGHFEVEWLEGGHFFLHDEADAVVARVREAASR